MALKCFWNYTKIHLSKFNDLTDNKFSLYLKEGEARFNYRDYDFAVFIAELFFEKK